MCNEKNCYFCKYLCFFDFDNVNTYLCTLTGMPYQKTKLKMVCEKFSEDFEE